MVPDNAFKAMSDNRLMLQVIFFAIFLGISMLLIGEKRATPLKNFFDSLNDVVLKMVDLIMLYCSLRSISLFLASVVVVIVWMIPDILVALAQYARCCSSWD